MTSLQPALSMTQPQPDVIAPQRAEFLPFALPDIGEEEIDEVVRTLRSGWITTGPRTKEFEQRFAEYVSVHAIVNQLLYGGAAYRPGRLAGVGPGDEVITSPLTFCSTANVVVHLGARPIFADICDDFNIDPAQIKQRITERTKAIIPVHHSGQPCRMDEIHELAWRYGLKVIEDAAHAAGATYREAQGGRPERCDCV